MQDEAQKPYIEGPLHSTSPVIDPGLTFASVTDKISSIVLKRKTSLAWFFGFAISFILFQLMLLTITNLVFNGIGLWGVNQPVGWGFAILNFVWWIGIGHAGTLISAILLLLRQKWRTSINRFAEAMTLFAVAQAGMYPIFHLGRPWLAYWLFPYPNTMDIWPQFRSPLMWDVFAVSTYATVSAMFWFVGLIPDFATLRDRARSKPWQILYVMLATGLIVGYGYIMEAFFGWYSGNKYERFMIWNRMHGPYAHYYWSLVMCNIVTPQFLWIKRVRSNLLVLWIISVIVSIGMWLERFVIVVTSLHRDYLPSSWGMYQPTQWDWAMFIGTIGFFFTLLFLFIRFLPMISIFEMRTILPAAEVEE